MLLKCHIQTLCGADSADDRLKYALRNDLRSSFDNVWICFINSSKRRKSPETENELVQKKCPETLFKEKWILLKKKILGPVWCGVMTLIEYTVFQFCHSINLDVFKNVMPWLDFFRPPGSRTSPPTLRDQFFSHPTFRAKSFKIFTSPRPVAWTSIESRRRGWVIVCGNSTMALWLPGRLFLETCT